MIILSGDNLCKRQKELNEKVNTATPSDFNTYKAELNDKSDIDKIFLIDLASRNKNIDFILETFKSGDNLYITRAINKSKWITEDEYANYINVSYLHQNIFTEMSTKMKKKLLKNLATELRSENRCIAFYEYCMKENLINIAIKFLNHTNEKFKQDVILQKSSTFMTLKNNMEDIIANFIGNSFKLTNTMLECMDNDWERSSLVRYLQYLYSISDVQYLDLMEKYKDTFQSRKIFGHRMSKDIMRKHKARVLKNPVLYLNILNKSKVVRNSTVNDVKAYAVLLLPEEAQTFWNHEYYETYKFILDILPIGERFSFIKKIFTDKYPGEPFEMKDQFYFKKLYKMMSAQEKENWALKHIESGAEIHGDGKDFIWYKFVNFKKAFYEIKKFIQITSKPDDRADILDILIQSAKSQDEIEIVLKYYSDRHINEKIQQKISFLEKFDKKHSALQFKDECWILFELILYSTELFDESTYDYRKTYFASITLVYHILKNKSVPPEVLNLLKSSGSDIVYRVKNICHDFKPDEYNKIMQYLQKFYQTEIEALAGREYEDVKQDIESYLNLYLDVFNLQNKTKDDIPEEILKLMKLEWDSFKHFFEEKAEEFSKKSISRKIKTNANLIVDEFPLIKKYILYRFGKTNWLTRKLQLYFHLDIGQKYLQLLVDSLSEEMLAPHMAKVSVHGILKLADDKFKMDFVQKYAPTNPKIDHRNIQRNLLYIQKAICSQAFVCRPPWPLTYVNQYLVGDYVHTCLPMFNYYLMNLPPKACLAFVASVIDKPVKIQKHALRLAFQCFSVDNLKPLVNDVWNRTKNNALRKVLYKSLYKKILGESEQTQMELFEVLINLTLGLREDDDEEIFDIFSRCDLPGSLSGKLLLVAWGVIEAMPQRCVNIDRLSNILSKIEYDHVNLVPADKVKSILDAHMSHIFNKKEKSDNESLNHSRINLYKAKWELAINYLANIHNDDQLAKNMILIKNVIQIILQKMQENSDFIVAHNFLHLFICDLGHKSYIKNSLQNYRYMKTIYAFILKEIQESGIEYHKLYLLVMRFRLMIISRDIIIMGKEQNTEEGHVNDIIKKCLEQYSLDLITMLTEYISNGKYYPSFSKLEEYIQGEIEMIHSHIVGYNPPDLFSVDDLIYLTCNGLMKQNTPEVFNLILRLLPITFTGLCGEQYKELVHKLERMSDGEIQCYYFQRFVLGSYVDPLQN